MPVNVTLDDRQLRSFLRNLTVLPRVRKKHLLRDVGQMAQHETRMAILGGGFKGPGKWVVAKKGVNKAMEGVDRKVFFQRITDSMGIVETTDPRFSLYQHWRGFTTPAGTGGVKDNVFGDWVRLPPLKQRSALHKPNKDPFMWNWRKSRTPSVVPARPGILPSEFLLAKKAERIAEKWAKRLVRESLKRAGV